MDFDTFLDNLLSSDADLRKTSESEWHEQETDLGVPGNILVYASNSKNLLGKRQLCMTLVKELIRNRWSELGSDNRQDILIKLLSLAVDSSASIRKLAHASIGMASRSTGFCNCSELVVSITQRLGECSEIDSGMLLDLLLVVIEETGGAALLNYVDVILTSIFPFASSAVLRGKSLAVFTCLLVNLARDDEFALIERLDFSSWTNFFFANSLHSLVTSVKRLIDAGLIHKVVSWIPQVVEMSVVALEQNRTVFESLIVTSEEGGIDENEDEGLVNLVVAICDLFSAIALTDENILANNDRIFLAIGPFLQITVSNEQEWLADPMAFIASEDEDFVSAVSIRLAVEGLVADMLDNPGLQLSVLPACREIIARGFIAESNGNCEFWRYIEAGLFLYGLAVPLDAEIPPLCAQLCSQQCHPLLKARAFAVLTKMKLTRGDSLEILKCSLEAMQGPVFVHFAAGRAFCTLVEKDTDSTLVREALGCFVRLARDEASFYFGLECLLATTRKCSAGFLGPEYHQFLIDVLVQRITDPLVSNIVLELVQVVLLVDRGIIDSFVPQLTRWLLGEKEFELEVALEFLEMFGKKDSLNPCIELLRSGKIASIGENCAIAVARILGKAS